MRGNGKGPSKERLLNRALALAGGGVSVVPCSVQEKQPFFGVLPRNPEGKRVWGPFQKSIADNATIKGWYGPADAVAVIGGRVSGNLEIVDHDEPALFGPWVKLVKALAPDLYERLIIAMTQGGGNHAIYRCSVIEGNQILAERWIIEDGKSKKEPLIETRGEGGYALVHPSKGYTILQGSFDEIPTITEEEREILLNAARSFNEATDDNKPGSDREPAATHRDASDGGRPGDDFNERGDVIPILEKAGWRIVCTHGEAIHLRRPHKDRGSIGATWNYIPDQLYVFTTNAYPFEHERSYKPFAIYAFLEHDRDFSAAAKELARQGYGDQSYSTRAGSAPGAGADADAGERSSGAQGAEDDLSFFLAEAADDEGNAQCVRRLHGTRFVYCQAFGWLQYDGKRWTRETAESELDKTILATLKQRRIAAVVAEKEAIVTATRGSAYKLKGAKTILKAFSEVAGTHFDRDTWLLNCNNGTLDLRTGELREHRRDDYITKITPVDYDPAATCPRWIRFLSEIFPKSDGEDKPAIRSFIAKAVGYSLTGETRAQCLIFAHGGGENGKSTFFEVIMALMGDYGHKTSTEALMASDRFYAGATPYLVNLKGTRFVVAAEIEQGWRLKESLVKDLTGGDTITGRDLFKAPIEFLPTHTLWMYGNHKPEIRGTDDAIWRRIRLVPFLQTFKGADADEGLKDELVTELPGILAWAVRGCLDWQRDGLQAPDAVRDATSDYRNEQDALARFFDDCCVLGPKAKAVYGELYKAYERWGGEMPKRQFGATMRERGFEQRAGADNVQFFHGIGLLASEETKEPYYHK